MVKKADRQKKAQAREASRQHSAREEAAMQAFLSECRASMPLAVWEKHSEEARRSAGRTFHIVEWMVSVLAETQQPITPPLRRAIDAMLDALRLDRRNVNWDVLQRLNYDQYWKSRYGY